MNKLLNLDHHCSLLKSQGYTVLPSLIGKNKCTELKSILESTHSQYAHLHFKPTRIGSHGLDDKSTEKVVYNLHNKHIAFFDLIGHEVILHLIKNALKEGSYQNSDKVIHTLSTARSPLKSLIGQQLHIDARMPGTPFATNIIALWMIDDFKVENGATRIVPNSHTKPFFPENGKTYSEEISITAPAGSVLLYNGSLWHGGGPKQSDEDRWACIFSYARWYLKPSFDFNRNMPKDIYDKISDECRELLGYKVTPPTDEFTRLSMRSEVFEPPSEYNLPKSSN
jgi:hypothetical protein